jgi:ribosome-associated toxin RatA of RatAB toxin-antitoxin module
MSHRYVFHTSWHLDAHPDEVYAALHDVARYPEWWPQVRSVRAIDEVTGELRCRSMLPYDLVFVVTRETEDPVARVLAARQTGDLEGTSRWTITADDSGSVAVFDEDVVVRKALVRAALRFNHDLMMRDGERGLRRYLQR